MGRERFLISAALVLDREERCARLDGRPLRLGAKAIAVLDALMSEPGRLLPKERLFDLAWPEQAVSDSVLTTAIKEVRQALNDNARQPEWIATEHGRGYRYLQDVTPSAVDPGLRALPSSPVQGEVPAKVTTLQWPLVLARASRRGVRKAGCAHARRCCPRARECRGQGCRRVPPPAQKTRAWVRGRRPPPPQRQR